MSMSLWASVMASSSWSAGLAATFSIVVRTSSSALLYLAKANLPLDVLLMASLMCEGEMPGAPIRLFFSMDLMMRRRCLACGVQGAEGAWVWPIPGPVDVFFLLVGTSLNPSVSIPAADIAAQVCFTACAVLGFGGLGFVGVFLGGNRDGSCGLG